jgi:1,4-dihydroxy-6-naphthoate synthase
MTATAIEIGISTCPNDTFAFDGLLRGEVEVEGVQLNFHLLDIDELNRALFAGRLDVAKASFHAALLLAEQMWVLPCGAALGFGAGPLLLAARPGSTPDSPEVGAGRDHPVYVCPGEHTTAHLLLRLFHGAAIREQRADVRQVVFPEVFAELKAGTADFGVCIHEGRFTWQDHQLSCVEDLGARWERSTGQPLPLGGILARRGLDRGVLSRMAGGIARSIARARLNPDATLPMMRRHAQELRDEVLWQHVGLYVNDWTLELGPTGARALQALHAEAVLAGIIPANSPGLAVFNPE